MAVEAAAGSGIDPLDDADVDGVVAEFLNAVHLGLFVDAITSLGLVDGVVSGSLETVVASSGGAVSVCSGRDTPPAVPSTASRRSPVLAGDRRGGGEAVDGPRPGETGNGGRRIVETAYDGGRNLNDDSITRLKARSTRA